MLRNSAVDFCRALVGLSAEKSMVVPLRRSPLNSSRSCKLSIEIEMVDVFRLSRKVLCGKLKPLPLHDGMWDVELASSLGQQGVAGLVGDGLVFRCSVVHSLALRLQHAVESAQERKGENDI